MELPSSVLFKSVDDASVVVIDIPRSLEEAQVLPGEAAQSHTTIKRRIVSTHALETPWRIPEPKQKKKNGAFGSSSSAAAAVAELMTLETVKAAIKTVRGARPQGPWCLPRITTRSSHYEHAKETEKSAQNGEDGIVRDRETEIVHAVGSKKRKYKASAPVLMEGDERNGSEDTVFIPEQAHYLLGTVESHCEAFMKAAPQFDLIVLDPPWPSRSVRRKSDSYGTVRNIEEAGDLLCQIPVRSHLKPDGLVAIWVTNKAAVTDLLTAHTGTLAQWGLEPIGEWIWLKTTSTGEPVLDIESAWRKPWERLIIARKRGNSAVQPVQTKVIFGVPDFHSRKPNLRGLFEEVLPRGYLGLEVFARNLTAGWWSWGNEVLRFQKEHHWVTTEEEGHEIASPL
ncbi:MT-A70-domain-containing protein [Xylariaceae sp. FL0594]|nr:MT-A70-domain-containing protein [Xylariaceae sp. FL0594]